MTHSVPLVSQAPTPKVLSKAHGCKGDATHESSRVEEPKPVGSEILYRRMGRLWIVYGDEAKR